MFGNFRGIPALLTSAILRSSLLTEPIKCKWFGNAWRKYGGITDHVISQNTHIEF